jgi:hypothetical protein
MVVTLPIADVLNAELEIDLHTQYYGFCARRGLFFAVFRGVASGRQILPAHNCVSLKFP